VLRAPGYRFHFFASEEQRIHVHAIREGREAKIWLEPRVELAENVGLRRPELAVALALVKEHQHEIRKAWHAFHGER
jgi:hypothetical protein